MRTFKFWIVPLWATCLLAQTPGRVVATLAGGPDGSHTGIRLELVLAGGDKPVAIAESDSSGLLVFHSVPAGDYDVRGPDHRVLARAVRVFAGAETDLGPIGLDAGAANRTSSAGPGSPEEQLTALPADILMRLPVLARQETALVDVVTGAGVAGSTFLNGLSPTYARVSLGGVDLADQFARGGIDGAVGQPRLDQVEQMVVLSNFSSAYGFGYPAVAMVTPSGTNRYHGELFWMNRNSHFAANSVATASLVAKQSFRHLAAG